GVEAVGRPIRARDKSDGRLTSNPLQGDSALPARSLAAKECVAPHGVVATLIAMTVEGSMALKDVKNHLSEVVDQVEREHDRVVITKHGRAAAVVLSVDDLASLEETLDIAGRPTLIKQIRASLADLAAGEAEVLTKDEILRSLGE
ncbi:MAG: type II toxin-antitoxin system Phd/YefM family antitoxin, partial [Actinomycetota bacterium]